MTYNPADEQWIEQHHGAGHLDTPLEDLDTIMLEIWSLLKIENIWEAMGHCPEEQDTRKLDAKLLEVLSCAHRLNSDVLLCWLRYTYAWRTRLPTWRLLLNAVHEHLLLRHPANMVDDLLLGLTPYTQRGTT